MTERPRTGVLSAEFTSASTALPWELYQQSLRPTRSVILLFHLCLPTFQKATLLVKNPEKRVSLQGRSSSLALFQNSVSLTRGWGWLPLTFRQNPAWAILTLFSSLPSPPLALQAAYIRTVPLPEPYYLAFCLPCCPSHVGTEGC